MPVTVAAGNEFTSICAEPAFDPGALCVTSTDRRELRSSFSNWGVKPDLNVVTAPGGAALLACEDDIVSTVPKGAESSCGSNGYDYYAGTSMATPFVAGVAAMLTAQGRSVSQVYAALKSTARTPGPMPAASTRRSTATGSSTRPPRSRPGSEGGAGGGSGCRPPGPLEMTPTC